mgnify:CR=1 FL=1
MDSIGKTLRNLRKMHGLQQIDVVTKLKKMGVEVNQQKMSRWENGRNSPNAEQFIALCKVYHVKDAYKVFAEQDYSEPSPALNKEGERKLAEFKQLLLASGMYSPVMPEKKVVRFPGRMAPLYSIGASAGTGQFLDSRDYEMIGVPDEVPLSANFALHVCGDSMEPTLHNGDIIWIQQQPTLENGEIGVFFLDGNAYVKEFSRTSVGVYLLSHNKDYAPIEIHEYNESKIYGKVVYPIV